MIGLEAIAIRLEVIALRLEAIAIRLEAIAIRLEIPSTTEGLTLVHLGVLRAKGLHHLWITLDPFNLNMLDPKYRILES